MSKFTKLNDYTPEQHFYSRQNRSKRALGRAIIITAILTALVILIALRLVHVGKCAEAGGFYVSDYCNSTCCDKVPVHPSDIPWKSVLLK